MLEELNTSIVGIVGRTDSGDRSRLARRPAEEPGGRTGGALPGGAFSAKGLASAAPEGELDSYVAGIAGCTGGFYAYADAQRNPGEAIVALWTPPRYRSRVVGRRPERARHHGRSGVRIRDTFDAGIAYTALGHIHKAQRIGGREAVSLRRSPLPMSFSEKKLPASSDSRSGRGGEGRWYRGDRDPKSSGLDAYTGQPVTTGGGLAMLLAGLPEPEEGRGDESRWP